ncbi:hypothetical protein ACQP1V_42715 (plasmid) [Microtetraspora malaysiensis]|uniref:hypothetical protein n=1 Tax=Microtetraspora malaysiensis TaxID=161358 RepID=UPI003D8BAADB
MTHVEYNSKVNPERLSLEARRAAARGLKHATEHVLGVSNSRVPHRMGKLEDSGAAVVDDARLVGIVSYDTVYAVAQHENLDWKHIPGRTAKYLELAVREEAEVVKLLIAAKLREVFK